MDNIKEAVIRACQEPTLLDALTWICIWESERVIYQARYNFGSGSNEAGWDTCFRVCLKQVMESYEKLSNQESKAMNDLLSMNIDHIILWHTQKAAKTVNKRKAEMHRRYSEELAAIQNEYISSIKAYLWEREQKEMNKEAMESKDNE